MVAETPSSNHASVPVHLAVIPDGNRRWAQEHGKSVAEGHAAGYRALARTADAAFERGIKVLTGYAFSTENWSRTSDEVGALMKLVHRVITLEGERFHKKGIRIRIIGADAGLDRKLLSSMRELEERTADNSTGTICLCFNYGGRADIVAAAQSLAANGNEITETSLRNALSTAGIPDPDLVIRTSGEQRLSNFLLWETAYSELYFSNTLWPDFAEADLDAALAEYATRKRRYGR